MGLVESVRHRQRARRARRQRLCGACHTAKPHSRLRRWEREWLCPVCLARLLTAVERDHGGENAAIEALEARLAALDRQPTLEDRIEATVRWVFLLGRVAFYLAFYLVAQSSELARHAFHGFLLADVAAWGIQVFFGLRHAQLRLFLEFLAYIAIVRLFYELPGAFVLPQSAEDRALVALCFMGVFSVRVGWFFLKLRFEGEDGEE